MQRHRSKKKMKFQDQKIDIFLWRQPLAKAFSFRASLKKKCDSPEQKKYRFSLKFCLFLVPALLFFACSKILAKGLAISGCVAGMSDWRIVPKKIMLMVVEFYEGRFDIEFERKYKEKIHRNSCLTGKLIHRDESTFSERRIFSKYFRIKFCIL